MIDQATFAMYPFAHLDDAYGAFWQCLRDRVTWLPRLLNTRGDPASSWLDPSLAVGMTCGWPLVTRLRDQVQTIGSFHYAVEGATDFRYRSVIINSLDADRPITRAVINNPHSLSGHISLLRYAVVTEWPGELIESGSHRLSVEAVALGEADIASIDAATFAYFQDSEPETLSNVVVVGAGPAVPSLPLICSPATDDSQVAELRRGIADTVVDPAIRAAMATLRISGFSPLDLSDYDRFLL